MSTNLKFRIGARVLIKKTVKGSNFGKIIDVTLGVKDPSEMKYKVFHGELENGERCVGWFRPDEIEPL